MIPYVIFQDKHLNSKKSRYSKRNSADQVFYYIQVRVYLHLYRGESEINQIKSFGRFIQTFYYLQIGQRQCGLLPYFFQNYFIFFFTRSRAEVEMHSGAHITELVGSGFFYITKEI